MMKVSKDEFQEFTIRYSLTGVNFLIYRLPYTRVFGVLEILSWLVTTSKITKNVTRKPSCSNYTGNNVSLRCERNCPCISEPSILLTKLLLEIWQDDLYQHIRRTSQTPSFLTVKPHIKVFTKDRPYVKM